MSEQNETVLTVATPQAPAAPVPVMSGMWAAATFGEAWQMAQALAKADIAPQTYRNKPENCVIVLDIANRMGISPLAVMQYSQVVQGQFTWKGMACKAMIDGCGKYRNSRYEEKGKQGSPDWGFRLVAERVSTGETVCGPWVTWKMATDEGWATKGGSKWKTMPELMFRYRAAAFFMRTECAAIGMGFQTADEVGDVLRVDPDAPEPKPVICEDCKQAVTPTKRASVAVIVNHSKDKFDGKTLCADCQRKRRREAAQKPVEPPVDAPEPQDEWNTAPAQETPQNGDTGEMEPL